MKSKDGRCLKTIRQKDTAANRKTTVRAAKKLAARVSVVFLILFLAFAVPFTTVSAFRTATIRFIVDQFGKGAVVCSDENSLEDDRAYSVKSPTWFPEGTWRMVFLSNEGSIYLIDYADENSNKIFYSEGPVEGSTFGFDTENAELITDIRVNGNKAVMSVKGEMIILVWIDDYHSTICSLEVHGQEFVAKPEIVLKIAESIQ